MKFLLLFLALLLALTASLTLRRAPDWVWAWKLAIVAGEYGHWLLLTVIAVAIGAWISLEGGARMVALIVCIGAIVGFLRPALSARKLATELPGELRANFGAAAIPPAPVFSWQRLYRGSVVPPARVETEVFARSDGHELKLDFYSPASRPDARQDLRPCLVVIHGGGWDGGDRTQLAAWNSRWVAQGWAVAAVSYRLAPESIWPAQRDDVLAAVAWLKQNASRLELDPTRLVLLGRSAGGQLATAVGYGAADPAIRGVIALYAPHDLPFAWSVSREDDALNSIKLFRQYFGGPPDTPERRAAYAAASGQLLARADSPPTLLIHGEPDTLAWSRHSARLAGRLAELRVPHYVLSLPWATHGFDFNADGPGGQLADAAIGAFLAARAAAGPGPSAARRL